MGWKTAPSRRCISATRQLSALLPAPLFLHLILDLFSASSSLGPKRVRLPHGKDEVSAVVTTRLFRIERWHAASNVASPSLYYQHQSPRRLAKRSPSCSPSFTYDQGPL